MRTSAQQRELIEARIRAAMDRLLAGALPAGGKCDVKTLATEAGIARSALYATYAHLKRRVRAAARQYAERRRRPRPTPGTNRPAHSRDRRSETASGQLLHRLAPWAKHLDDKQDLSGTRHSPPDRLAAVVRGLAGYSLGVHEPVNDTGVASVLFRARRPMHPQRLQAALPWLATNTLRSRGHVWLATQPDQVIGWESAGGGIALSGLGRWLAALPKHRWHEASDLRRLAAQLEWDPYYGDRGHHLLFIGIGLDPAELHQSLAACLLTDDELALGEDGWKHLPDPFAGCFTHHHADTEDSP